MHPSKWLKTASLLIALSMLIACGGGGNSDERSTTDGDNNDDYAIKATIRGLENGAVLEVNNADTNGNTISYANGEFIWRSSVNDGYSNKISIIEPTNYHCSIDYPDVLLSGEDWTKTVINCQLWKADDIQLLTSSGGYAWSYDFSLNANAVGLMGNWGEARPYDPNFGWLDTEFLLEGTDHSLFNTNIFTNSVGESLVVLAGRGANGNSIELYARTYSRSSGWSNLAHVAQIADVDRLEQLTVTGAMNNKGNAVIAWLTDLGVSVINYSPIAGWSTPVVATNAEINTTSRNDVEDLHLKVAIDDSGNAVVVWENAVFDSHFNKYSNLYSKRYIVGQGWEAVKQFTDFSVPWDFASDLLHDFDIVMNSNGAATMAWVSRGHLKDSVWIREYMHSTGWSNANVRLPMIYSEENVVDVKLTVDKNAIYMAWVVNTWNDHSTLYTANKPHGGVWSERTEVLSNDKAIKLNDMEANGNGVLFIAFTEHSDGLINGVEWPISTTHAVVYSPIWGWGDQLEIGKGYSDPQRNNRILIESGDTNHVYFVIDDDDGFWAQRIKHGVDDMGDITPPDNGDDALTINIIGTWGYVLTYKSCSGQTEYGTATWTYHSDGYGLSTSTSNILNPYTCNFDGPDSTSDGGDHFSAVSPITHTEFTAGLNDYNSDYFWSGSGFVSANKIIVTGSFNGNGSSASLIFTR